MTIQGVLQHLSPMKLVMKSFPLNALNVFGCSASVSKVTCIWLGLLLDGGEDNG